ncbi:MAG: rRNA maturation RNase YbeY [Litorivicinus sp.]
MQIDLQIDAAEAPEPDSIIAWARWASGELLDLPALPEQTELSIQVLDDTAVQNLNREFRGKDVPTNVLSFPYEAMPGIDVPLLGDIVLCAPVIAREAAEQGKNLHDHWAHMLVHGVLHLRGFDHIRDDEAEEMEALERAILSAHGVSDPYE